MHKQQETQDKSGKVLIKIPQPWKPFTYNE